MEKLPALKILKFHPDTLQVVRKMYELDKPGQMDEAIDILQDWLKQQNYIIKKDFSRGYLERTIISTKGSVERAKTRLDKVCTLRTLLPFLFGDYDYKNYFKEMHETQIVHAILPELTADQYRIFAIKAFGSFNSTESLYDYHRDYLILTEYVRRYDYAAGLIYLIDFRGFDFIAYMKNVDIIELKHFFTMLLEGYGMRLKGMHLLSSSKLIETLIVILRQVLSPKLVGRIQVHRTVESIHEYLPKEIIPSDFGGSERSVKELQDEWTEVLALKENVEYQREMNKALIDKSLRPTEKFSEEHMGLPGTFRTLRVD